MIVENRDKVKIARTTGVQIAGEDNIFAGRLFDQAMLLYVIPEVRKRIEGKNIKKYVLKYAQIIFHDDQRNPLEIRLNEECEIGATLTFDDPQNVKKGQELSLKDIQDRKGTFAEFHLPEHFQDSAHISIAVLAGQPYISCNGIYNSNKIRELLATSDEYIKTAILAKGEKMWKAFIDNSFSACELLAKATLMTYPRQKLGSHNAVQSQFCRLFHRYVLEISIKPHPQGVLGFSGNSFNNAYFPKN